MAASILITSASVSCMATTYLVKTIWITAEQICLLDIDLSLYRVQKLMLASLSLLIFVSSPDNQYLIEQSVYLSIVSCHEFFARIEICLLSEFLHVHELIVVIFAL